VKLRVATSAAVTVEYEAVEDTATAGEDYEDYPDPPGEFVFEIGESVASLPPPDIIDDKDDEPEETFTVELTAHYPGGLVSSARGTVTILVDGKDEIVD
jgi:hypothetical protein